MKKDNRGVPQLTVGLDLGDKYSYVFVLLKPVAPGCGGYPPAASSSLGALGSSGRGSTGSTRSIACGTAR